MRINNVNVFIAPQKEGLISYETGPPYLISSLQEYYSVFSDYSLCIEQIFEYKGFYYEIIEVSVNTRYISGQLEMDIYVSVIDSDFIDD